MMISKTSFRSSIMEDITHYDDLWRYAMIRQTEKEDYVENTLRELTRFKDLEHTLNDLCTVVHANNKEKGFYDKPREVGTLLALIHSEVSEALEADRTDATDAHLRNRRGIEVELADVVIRVLDLGAYLGLDIGGAVMEKIKYNLTRPHKHGNKEY